MPNNNDDLQAQAEQDRQFLGQLRYQRIPIQKQEDPLKELRQQRQIEREADEINRAAITLNVAHQMGYLPVDVRSQKSLAQQIQECQELLNYHQEQWERLRDYHGDKTVYWLPLQNTQKRLDELLELQAKG